MQRLITYIFHDLDFSSLADRIVVRETPGMGLIYILFNFQALISSFSNDYQNRYRSQTQSNTVLYKSTLFNDLRKTRLKTWRM